MEFLPETQALAWHIRHGRKVIFGSYEIPVPALWWASNDERGSAMLFGFPGRLRAMHLGKPEWGTMSFSVAPLPSYADERKAILKMDQLMGTNTKVVANLQIANEATVCLDSRHPSHADVVEIRCLPESEKGGLCAGYMGNRKYVDLFFATLRNVNKRPTS